MKQTLLVTISVTILSFSLTAAEPSAFGAGNLSSSSPYGLTSSEAVLLENKKKLHKVVVKSNNQANEVDSIRERLDGLQGMLDSLGAKSQENKLKLKQLEKKNNKKLKNSDEFEKRLGDVSQANNKLIQTNLQVVDANSVNIEKIKLVMKELSSLIDTINATYVTKDEFNSLVNDVNLFKELVAKELQNGSTPVTPVSNKSEFSDMSNKQISVKAREFYDAQNYTKSINYYAHLINVGSKPANAHYMIGEMKYYRKNYAEAIAYFKKSASLYSKASYMPDLMLHTARAMEHTGDNKNAKAFYNGLISKYSGTKQASQAKKYLDLMN